MAVANPARTTPADAPVVTAGAFTPPRSAALLETRSARYREALATLERFAKHDSVHVLLVGESGTGKTIFARRLHDRSPRAGRVFHRVALSAIADGLAPADLFGHLQGAFTDARSKRTGHFLSAHGGTLFLDEVGKASPLVQHTLLDAVERHEITPLGADRSVRVDMRLVAATNVPLGTLAAEGKFLPDLVTRLEGFVVRIPALRERRDDIALLAAHLAAVHSPQFGYRKPPTIDSDLMAALTEADWPGNVRELDVTIRRLLIEGEGAPIITLRHCTDTLAYLRPSRRGRVTAEEIVLAVEKEGNVTAAARKLGVSRTTVHKYVKGAATVATTVAADLAHDERPAVLGVCHAYRPLRTLDADLRRSGRRSVRAPDVPRAEAPSDTAHRERAGAAVGETRQSELVDMKPLAATATRQVGFSATSHVGIGRGTERTRTKFHKVQRCDNKLLQGPPCSRPLAS